MQNFIPKPNGFNNMFHQQSFNTPNMRNVSRKTGAPVQNFFNISQNVEAIRKAPASEPIIEELTLDERFIIEEFLIQMQED